MKRVYAEMFTPNEYVTACGDSGKNYKFTCNAGDFLNGYYLASKKLHL